MAAFMLVMSADQRGDMGKILAKEPAEQPTVDIVRIPTIAAIATFGRIKADITRYVAIAAATRILLEPVGAVPGVDGGNWMA